MGRTNGLTNKQKSFLEHWVQNGGKVQDACFAAGYTHRKNGYELLKKDGKDNYLNPYVQNYLDAIKGGKVRPTKDLIKEVPNDDWDDPNYNPDDANIDYLIRKMMEVLQDGTATANAKAQATRELRILLEQKGNVGADPTKGIEILRAKMLPHMRDMLPEHYQGDLDLGK